MRCKYCRKKIVIEKLNNEDSYMCIPCFNYAGLHTSEYIDIVNQKELWKKAKREWLIKVYGEVK